MNTQVKKDMSERHKSVLQCIYTLVPCPLTLTPPHLLCSLGKLWNWSKVQLMGWGGKENWSWEKEQRDWWW